MDNKFNIGKFVFCYSGDSVAAYGNINQINLDKDGYSYRVMDETELGDYPNQWHKEKNLYSTMGEFEKIAQKLRADTEVWIKDCKERLLNRLDKES